MSKIDWDEIMLDALRSSDGGNNPFYSDDPDTVSLAHQLGDAVRAQSASSQPDALARALRAVSTDFDLYDDRQIDAAAAAMASYIEAER